MFRGLAAQVHLSSHPFFSNFRATSRPTARPTSRPGPGTWLVCLACTVAVALTTMIDARQTAAETTDWSEASSLLASIPLTAPPLDAAVTSDGHYAYVASVDRLLVFDLLTRTQVGEVTGIGAFSVDFLGGSDDCIVVGDPFFQLLRRYDVSNPAFPVTQGAEAAGGVPSVVRCDDSDGSTAVAMSTGSSVTGFDGGDCATSLTTNGSTNGTFGGIDVWSTESPLTAGSGRIAMTEPDAITITDNENLDVIVHLALLFAPQDVRGKLMRFFFTDQQKVTEVDISDPENPAEVASADFPGAKPLDLADDQLFASANATTMILDTNSSLAVEQTIQGNTDIAQVFGNENVLPGDDNGFVTRGATSFETFRIGESPVIATFEFDVSGNTFDGVVTTIDEDSYVITSSQNDIQIFSDDGQLRANTGAGGDVVDATGNQIVALRSGELRIFAYDTEADQVTSTGTLFAGNTFTRDVAVSSDASTWVGAGTDNMIAWGDLVDGVPTLLGTVQGPSGLNAVDIDDYRILAGGESNWSAINVSDPQNPQEYASGDGPAEWVEWLEIDLPGDFDRDGIVGADDHVQWVGVNDDGTTGDIGDIDVDSRDLVQAFGTSGLGAALLGGGEAVLYLASESRVLAYDFTDPTQAEFLGSYSTEGLFLRGFGVGKDGVYGIRPDGVTVLPLHSSDGPTGVDEDDDHGSEIVSARLMRPIFPNPSADVATVAWESPTMSEFELDVFDAHGRKVRSLARGESIGETTEVWDGQDDRGRLVPAGVYYVRLEWDRGVESRAVSLVR